MLLSVFGFFFFLSDDLFSNENASYLKGFRNVDGALLLVCWVFKLQIYSQSCFTRQALLERFMAIVTLEYNKFNIGYEAVFIMAVLIESLFE